MSDLPSGDHEFDSRVRVSAQQYNDFGQVVHTRVTDTKKCNLVLAKVYQWSRNISWCLAQGYKNGDQRRHVGPCGCGRTTFFIFIFLVYFRVCEL